MASGLRAAHRITAVVRKVVKTVPSEWRAHLRRLPIDRDLVVYEAFAGSGMLCNPEALFRVILDDPDQAHRHHIWVLRDLERHADLLAEFRGNQRVRFVERGTLAYHRALATAGLLFNNATFPPGFSKRPGQIYVNTWHGTPLKRMGYDEAQGALGAYNVLRNFMMADFLLSTSPFMSEVMYEGAYRLANVAPGLLVEEGYPRTDVQFAGTSRAQAVERLRRSGVQVSKDDVVVLYAPTWRGESFHTARDDAAQMARLVDELQARLPANHRVLLKVHQQVAEPATREARLVGRLVGNEVPTNHALAATDLLVTDYSSIFFDFLSTRRPILFYAPDLEDYGAYRGWYVSPDDLPGPVVDSVDDLAKLVRASGSGSAEDPLVTHGGRREAARTRFAPWDDGAATQRVLDIVLREPAQQRRVRPTRRDGRPTLLIYLGGMKSNGITTSGLNLLRNLDHDRFDVSVVHNQSQDPERRSNFTHIDERVRQFVRSGGFNAGKRNVLRKRRLLSGAAERLGSRERAVLMELLLDDWRRTVGTAHFDHVIDFSGYSPLWSFMIGVAPAGTRSIWLHNDLAADQQREVEGRNPHRRNLAGVFTSYRGFDHLVSVSHALRDINAEKLSRWGRPEQFTWARNTIDADRMLRGAAEVPPAGLVPQTDGTIFVTVGRLSPEKNHQRLIKAFALVHAQHPDARLVLIGDGPLRDDITGLVARLGLTGAVTLTGLQPNPWAIMARCGAFVLSSDYEGQPMVILEARMLGLPVVSTEFDSVRGSLPAGVGRIVRRDVADLAEGMRAVLRGDVPHPPFDPTDYNRKAIDEFLQAIGASRAGDTHE
ncbi:MAG: CDP-glycerol glycerophosphotransferase family protein [Intrasporangium sp.]|uniref:glycosyltransferase n=1 Tax=Intrasporangium sp. TaxID=1925024 RepID=UPI0026470B9A|nr:glycosyltransferase [Intrasporangium sp.]MDN5794468.1 CDP-glycerol glycerophosphotransferase family protein [Intrasporangium sp.]